METGRERSSGGCRRHYGSVRCEWGYLRVEPGGNWSFAYSENGNQLPALTDDYLYNLDFYTAQTGPILFSSDITAAAFSWRTNPSTTTFSAYLNGALVGSFTAATGPDDSTGRYYGFEGIVFDELRMTSAPHHTFRSVWITSSTPLSPNPPPPSSSLAVWLGWQEQGGGARSEGREDATGYWDTDYRPTSKRALCNVLELVIRAEGGLFKGYHVRWFRRSMESLLPLIAPTGPSQGAFLQSEGPWSQRVPFGEAALVARLQPSEPLMLTTNCSTEA